jgi:ABC-type transporter Mla maintaining outer membrane lipid asymmetry permease subunit MlaE
MPLPIAHACRGEGGEESADPGRTLGVMDENQSQQRWHWRGEQVAIQTVGSALGTLIAALTFFLVGVLLGAIQDVDLATALSAVVGLLAALVGVVAAWRSPTALEAQVGKMSFEEIEQAIHRLEQEAERAAKEREG